MKKIRVRFEKDTSLSYIDISVRAAERDADTETVIQRILEISSKKINLLDGDGNLCVIPADDIISATVSGKRVKVVTERGVYFYRDVRSGKVLPITPRQNRFTVETIKSVEFSGNQGVVKTYPGFAGAVASVIDDNVHSGIMGTIAGDDVVLLIMRDGASIPLLLEEISRYISGFSDKLITNS